MHRYRETSRTSSNLAVGILSGVAIGAGLALLFAPKTGPTMRRDLSAGLTNMRDAIGTYFEQMAERAGVEFGHLGGAVETATADVEKKARTVIEAASDTIRTASDSRG